MTKTTGWFTRALLIAGVFLMTTGAAPAQTIADVPASHWAYEAVRELVEKGYVTLENGRFDGDQPVDRFTLATVVARILHEVESGAVAPRSEEDVELLRSVVNEFREELVQAFAQINQTSGRVDQNARSIVVVEGGMSEVRDLIGQLERRAAELEERSTELERRLADTDAAQQASLAQTASTIRAEIDRLSQLLADEEQARTALEAEVLAMIESLRQDASQDIARNEEAIAQTQTRVTALEEALKSELAAQGVELGDLEGRLSQATSNIESELGRLRSALEDEIAQQLAVEKERLTQLADGVQVELDELRSELNAQVEALLAQSIAMEQQRTELEARISEIESKLESQGTALAEADGELLRSIDALSRSVSSLESQVAAAAALADRMTAAEGRIEGVERQVLAMQSQIGLSEEQLAALSDRLMDELESQFQHSFLLAGQVAQELDSLRNEFNSYRQSTEQSLSRANQAQLFGIIGAILGLIGLAN